MTDAERFIADLQETASVLGCKIVVLSPHGSEAEPVEILP